MTVLHNDPSANAVQFDGLLVKLDEATRVLSETIDFAKPIKLHRVYDIARRVMMLEGGCAAIQTRARALEEAGVFYGSDWATPQILIPSLTTYALKSPNTDTLMVEVLSEFRLLAVALGDYTHPLISAEQARQFLTQTLTINLTFLFSTPSEAERETQGRLAQVPRTLLRYLAKRIGYHNIIDTLINEIWRILQQRPIQVEAVKQMITQIAVCRVNPDIDLGASGQGAERLVSALYGPTQATREDPGLDVYRHRLESMDSRTLQSEATGFSRAMHDTGLVSPYHAVFMRFLIDHGNNLIADAMGLSATGRDCMLCYHNLVESLIKEAIHPATAQAVYGLSLLLDRGILYQPPVAPAMWRQIGKRLSSQSRERIRMAYGDELPPRVYLLAGELCMLGLPLGVGQGDNPTCQSARALSMWAYNDPDFLLQVITWVSRDDEIVMHFEGQAISSKQSTPGLADSLMLDLDPVSLLVVPHLDRIYTEMGRRCKDRDGDPHRWVNPEFHGWWSGRGFQINVDVATGQITGLEDFLRHFYTIYHPFYNGNQPLIHPQPAGIAVTDSAARFIGWHAITIMSRDTGSIKRHAGVFLQPEQRQRPGLGKRGHRQHRRQRRAIR